MGTGDAMMLGGFTAIAMVVAVAALGVLVLAVIILASGRGDADPSGGRGHAVYLAAASFVALFTLLLATFGVIEALSRLVVDDDCAPWMEQMGIDGMDMDGMGMDGMDVDGMDVDGLGMPDDFVCPDRGDAVARDSVRAGLVAVLAGGILAFHLRRRREMLGEPGFAGSAAWRVDRAYLQTVCFTTVLIVLFAGASAMYEVFRLAAPGVTGQFVSRRVERQGGTSGLISLGYLALAASWIFRRHWLQVRPEPPIDDGAETSEAAGSPSPDS